MTVRSIKIVAECPRIVLDGVVYPVKYQTAKMAEMLWQAKGAVVSYNLLLANTKIKNKGCLQTLMNHLKEIFKAHGYVISAEFQVGYRLCQEREDGAMWKEAING